MFNSRFIQISALFLFSGIVFLGSGCVAQQDPLDLYVDAVMLNDLGKHDEAVGKLEAAVGRDDEFGLAYSLMGEIYQKLEEYDKSAQSYEKATEINPWSFKDFFNLGKVYQTVKKFSDAVKAYARSCELDPEHFDAHLNAAKCYYELEDFNNALKYGEQAESLNGNAGDLQEMLGNIYQSRRDNERAISAYKRALELEGNKSEIMISLAVAYLRAGENVAARELLISTIDSDPKNNTAYQYLGYCLLRLKQTDEAIDSYNRAIELKEDDWMAHKGVGVAYMLKAIRGGQEELKVIALDHWKRSLAIKDDQPELKKLLKKYSS